MFNVVTDRVSVSLVTPFVSQSMGLSHKSHGVSSNRDHDPHSELEKDLDLYSEGCDLEGSKFILYAMDIFCTRIMECQSIFCWPIRISGKLTFLFCFVLLLEISTTNTDNIMSVSEAHLCPFTGPVCRI